MQIPLKIYTFDDSSMQHILQIRVFFESSHRFVHVSLYELTGQESIFFKHTIHLFQPKKEKKNQKTRKIIHPKLLEKLPEITRNYAIPRTRIKRRGGTWRRGEKRKKKEKNKRQLWKTVRNWSGATRSAASFASNDIACAPKSMVKQFAGHLHDILMQFAWVRGSGARTTRESIHPIFPTLHRGFIVSSCVHEDVDRGYTIFRIDYRILWSIIPSCNIFSRINCKPKIDQFWFQRRRRWMYKCET